MSDPRFWMQTYTNTALRFDAPFDLDISIKDIARPLSRIPRFCGHTTVMLSVAEHSLVVAKMLKNLGPLVEMHGLLHDAHEAFTSDMPAPFKRWLFQVYGIDINSIQAALQTNILAALGIPLLNDMGDVETLAHTDLVACKIERDIYMKSQLEWDVDHIQYGAGAQKLYDVLSPSEAYKRFLDRYEILKKELGDANS